MTIRSKEAYGISNIAKKLIIFFVHDVPKIPAAIQETLLDEFARLTCLFSDGAALEDLVSIYY